MVNRVKATVSRTDSDDKTDDEDRGRVVARKDE